MRTASSSKMKYKRVYRCVDEWEEIRYNMWGTVVDRNGFLEKAIAFTGDHALYGKYMMRVVKEWSVSTENALTDPTISRRAWVGHAATALALRCPEDITRQAWGRLTDEQRVLANAEADRAIDWWEKHYTKHR